MDEVRAFLATCDCDPIVDPQPCARQDRVAIRSNYSDTDNVPRTANLVWANLDFLVPTCGDGHVRGDCLPERQRRNGCSQETCPHSYWERIRVAHSHPSGIGFPWGNVIVTISALCAVERRLARDIGSDLDFPVVVP